MAQRIDYQKAARDGIRIMYEMERYLKIVGWNNLSSNL